MKAERLDAWWRQLVEEVAVGMRDWRAAHSPGHLSRVWPVLMSSENVRLGYHFSIGARCLRRDVD